MSLNTAPNDPPPEPHVHAPGIHSHVRRSQRWIFVAFCILAIATTIALWRQQDNFDEHQRINTESCHLALVNRQLLRKAIDIELIRERREGETPTPEYQNLEDRIDKLILETKQTCKKY